MKYPIGLLTFNKIIEDGYLYVDNTDLVYKHIMEGYLYIREFLFGYRCCDGEEMGLYIVKLNENIIKRFRD